MGSSEREVELVSVSAICRSARAVARRAMTGLGLVLDSSRGEARRR